MVVELEFSQFVVYSEVTSDKNTRSWHQIS